MREFISDKIADEYKEWGTQNIVFLTAPTGSGKTTFVLNKLLKHIESKEKSKILYLVNRKILKDQIKKKLNVDIRYKVENTNEKIEVKTYQELEMSHVKAEYDIIIADECHYFFSDSTYNPHTCISYDWIMGKRRSALLVFISATIDRIEEYILNDIRHKELDPSEIAEDPRITENLDPEQIRMREYVERTIKEIVYADMDHIPHGEFCVREYGAEADYSHVDIHILEGIDSISETIKEKKENGWYS